MFTIEQINHAHSKVRSGADFPAYIQDLRSLGVTAYDTFVTDGHTDYSGSGHYLASSLPQYPDLSIAERSDAEQFETDLKAHQQGHTNYHTFCNDCAISGIYKWTVNIGEMTCTYYDKAGSRILTEAIPN